MAYNNLSDAACQPTNVGGKIGSMQNPEHNGGIDKSKKPLKGSVFDRPGPLFPGFEPGKTNNFDQEMRLSRRMLSGLALTAIASLIATAWCSPKKRK